ncbi:hypothetical protein BO71DRAFT_442594 [Aspergillus ellipticus CBS 707.79]|uniref:FAD/NAD(P)-binding domain-containing protein n=1 Tax=Aspergillus ellipticus CBS 707.79 TaxID=1448320 RepID=A0A319D4S0_9EURO|nr:hypothetical protein BO71DRAFT_442594 [Aspergillus ellipticus CBS 707.79]
MAIPQKAAVLVIGGGPGGSYTAAALAREGIDTVVLEADVFPRYHIGESLVASIRPLLKFIELDEKFEKRGFTPCIRTHNGTTSVGVVMNQEMATEKKKSSTATSSREFYLESVDGARGIAQLLKSATLDSQIKQASDWSYNASWYGSPYLRIVGDAGAFIDPYFSSGVHLALSGGLSAAVSIVASLRGDCDEDAAWNWHSHGVANRYGRFLLVVLGATKQIRARDSPVMNQQGDDGFDMAFTIIKPVIQGTADVQGKVSEQDVYDAVTFSTGVVQPTSGQEGVSWLEKAPTPMSAEEQEVGRVMNNLAKAYKAADAYEGLMARLERGNLGLDHVQEGA